MGKKYGGVIKTARMFARTNLAKHMGNSTKKKILAVGAEAVNKILSGDSPSSTIKEATTSLASQLPAVVKKKFKSSILGQLKSKAPKRFSRIKKTKIGGATRYRLKQKSKLSAKTKKLELLYRLNAYRRKNPSGLKLRYKLKRQTGTRRWSKRRPQQRFTKKKRKKKRRKKKKKKKKKKKTKGRRGRRKTYRRKNKTKRKRKSKSRVKTSRRARVRTVFDF